MEHLDIDTSSLAEGDHLDYLNSALQAQINLLTYKVQSYRLALVGVIRPAPDVIKLIARSNAS